MDNKYTVQPLDKQMHDRAAFSSGVDSLDRFLKQQATQDAKKNICQTYVLCEPSSPTILGYYTLSSSSIQLTHLAPDLARRLPRYESFPTMLLVRLALDQQYQRRGLGGILLLDALAQCCSISQRVGVLAVIVDALDDTAGQFYLHYGFQSFVDKPLSFYMPIADILLIPEIQQTLIPEAVEQQPGAAGGSA